MGISLENGMCWTEMSNRMSRKWVMKCYIFKICRIIRYILIKMKWGFFKKKMKYVERKCVTKCVTKCHEMCNEMLCFQNESNYMANPY